jgi:hypothetical protein
MIVENCNMATRRSIRVDRIDVGTGVEKQRHDFDPAEPGCEVQRSFVRIYDDTA